MGECFRAFGVVARMFPPLFVVHLKVSVEPFLICKPLAAFGAFERLLARVRALVMLREIATFPEILVALDALMKALLRNKIGFSGSNLTLFVRFSLAPFFRLQANIRVYILLIQR